MQGIYKNKFKLGQWNADRWHALTVQNELSIIVLFLLEIWLQNSILVSFVEGGLMSEKVIVAILPVGIAP